MNFDIVGPFEVTRHGSKKLVTKQSVSQLEQELEKMEDGLSKACGCYVFVVGSSFMPYLCWASLQIVSR